MQDNRLLSPILECPLSKSPVEIKNNHVYSKSNQYTFNNYSEIPWFFKNPQIHLYQWQQNIKKFLISIEKNIEFLESEISQNDLLKETQARLKNLHQAERHNSQELLKILSPFVEQAEVESPVLRELLIDHIPATQHLNSYFQTLFRDWAWNQNNENQQALDLTLSLIPDKTSRLVVLGTGASRLTYDLHLTKTPDLTLGVDINPLLLLVAQSVIRHKSIALYELSPSPIDIDQVAVLQKLKSKSGDSEKLCFLFADALNLPLQAKSVDCILTPWFIDIIPQDLKLFARRLNHSLQTGGVWANMGPLGYSNTFSRQSYRKDELEKILEDTGFRAEVSEVHNMDYLVSPNSSQARREKVLCFRAVKIKDAKQPPYYNTLPSWVLNAEESIPHTPWVEHTQIKSKTHFELLSCIDGQRTQKEIVQLMVKNYGMTSDVAEKALLYFLVNLFEQRL